MYATEHPSLPPMKERAAASLGTLLRSLRELRYAADDAHKVVEELSIDLSIEGCIPDMLSDLILSVEEAMGALGARVPSDPRFIAQTWAARTAAKAAVA